MQFSVAVVRVPAVRCAAAVCTSSAPLSTSGTPSASTAVVVRPRRHPARRPRHPGHRRQHRLRPGHRPHPASARRRRRPRRRLDRRPATGHPAPTAGERPRREYLPYDELLPRTAVYVTNGGYGGVQYALRYGVPDRGHRRQGGQARGRRPGRMVGCRAADPDRTTDPAPLRRAILAVLDDPRYRRAGQRVAAEMVVGPRVHRPGRKSSTG